MPRPKAAPKDIPVRPLWRIVLNYSRAVEIHYNHAATAKDALNKIFYRVAKSHDVPVQYVRGMFDGHIDNFKVEIDSEWKAKTGYACNKGKSGKSC